MNAYKQLIAVVSLMALMPIAVSAQTTGPIAPENQPAPASDKPKVVTFDIASFSSISLNGWHMKNGGKTEGVKAFKVGFKLLGEGNVPPEDGRVYLYNNKRELVATLDHLTSQAGQMQNMPNLVGDFQNLKKNVTYTGLFIYEASVKWKYAVVVLSTPDVAVAETLPHSEKVESFEFKEKAKLISEVQK